MNPFEARLLLPDTLGTPKHICQSTDARVLLEFDDPAVTAVNYMPEWSPGVQMAFNQIAQLPYKPKTDFCQQAWDVTQQVQQQDELAGVLNAGNIQWLYLVLFSLPQSQSQAILAELAEKQTSFIEQVGRLTRHRPVDVRFEVADYPMQSINTSIHQPNNIANSRAHTDQHNTGLKTYPYGTVLVDQTDLEIERLRSPLADFHVIKLEHLANRLWQVPAGSFTLWRGEGGAKPGYHPQYHFVPHMPCDTRRMRLFAHA